MPKQQYYFGFKPSSRPEQLGNNHLKSTKDRKHRPLSCDDSTPERESVPDGVFGKDRSTSAHLGVISAFVANASGRAAGRCRWLDQLGLKPVSGCADLTKEPFSEENWLFCWQDRVRLLPTVPLFRAELIAVTVREIEPARFVRRQTI